MFEKPTVRLMMALQNTSSVVVILTHKLFKELHSLYTVETVIPKAYFSFFLQKLYTVCDVALCVINSKSALCNADSPKDPVLPTKFFTQPEKVHL